MAATLGLQAESLAELATDVRFDLFQVGRAYARVIGDVGLRDVADTTSSPAPTRSTTATTRVRRLVPNGGPALASDPTDPHVQTPGRSAGGA